MKTFDLKNIKCIVQNYYIVWNKLKNLFKKSRIIYSKPR